MDFSLTLPNLVGYVGVVFLLGAYAALQAGRLSADAPLYSVLNLVAALLITVSLLYNWNAASFVIEMFWIAISAYGLWRALRKRASSKPGHQPGTPPE